jgi:hypothetical protein
MAKMSFDDYIEKVNKLKDEKYDIEKLQLVNKICVYKELIGTLKLTFKDEKKAELIYYEKENGEDI